MIARLDAASWVAVLTLLPVEAGLRVLDGSQPRQRAPAFVSHPYLAVADDGCVRHPSRTPVRMAVLVGQRVIDGQSVASNDPHLPDDVGHASGGIADDYSGELSEQCMLGPVHRQVNEGHLHNEGHAQLAGCLSRHLKTLEIAAEP